MSIVFAMLVVAVNSFQELLPSVTSDDSSVHSNYSLYTSPRQRCIAHSAPVPLARGAYLVLAPAIF